MGRPKKRQLADEESRSTKTLKVARHSRRTHICDVSGANGQSTPVEPAGLLGKLPAELRNRIYDLVLLEDGPIFVHYGQAIVRTRSSIPNEPLRPRWREPGILRAAKWIRVEAKGIYYQTHEFRIGFGSSNIAAMCKWVRVAAQNAHPSTLKLGKLVLICSCWDDIYTWLPLAKLFYDVDFGLSAGDFKGCFYGHDGIQQPVLGPSYWKADTHASVLCEVVMLGLKARKEGVHETLLELEFEDWVEDTLHSVVRTSRSRRRIKAGFDAVQQRLASISASNEASDNADDSYRGQSTDTYGRTRMTLRSRK